MLERVVGQYTGLAFVRNGYVVCIHFARIHNDPAIFEFAYEDMAFAAGTTGKRPQRFAQVKVGWIEFIKPEEL